MNYEEWKATPEGQKCMDVAPMSSRLAFAAGAASRDAEIAELVAALSSLLCVIPAEVECNNMHHVPKHRHSHDETCPVVVAYGEAILQASKALAKVRKS